jgi:hypothetical protein
VLVFQTKKASNLTLLLDIVPPPLSFIHSFGNNTTPHHHLFPQSICGQLLLLLLLLGFFRLIISLVTYYHDTNPSVTRLRWGMGMYNKDIMWVEGFVRVVGIVVTYSQFDSNIRVFYVFLGFFRNILKYFIQRPIFKPLYFYNDFFKIFENTSF